jgi:hypothetical protein
MDAPGTPWRGTIEREIIGAGFFELVVSLFVQRSAMKSSFVACAAMLAAGPCWAGPAETAIVAAMRLSENRNYSWRSTVTDDARCYDIEGKTDPSGYTWVRLPIVKSIADRLGREAEQEVEAFFRGPDTYVLRTEHGWKTFDELPRRSRMWAEDADLWPPLPPPTRGSLGTGAIGGWDPIAMPRMVVPMPLGPGDDEQRPYSNAQFALSCPHDELAIIVGSFTELKIEGDLAAGALTDMGARLLLVRDGQDQLKPLCAAGVFTLQIRNGFVTRYTMRLEGVLQVDGKKVLVHQVSDTSVNNVGTTTFYLPDEARRKLGR